MSDLQLFDALPAHIEAALRASIERFGVLVPVVVDQDGRTLDGHHRQRIAAEVGAECPTRTVRIADDDEAREVARTLNADRRHLTEDQRRQVAADLRQQGHSLRAIAGALGTNHSQIRRDLAGGTNVPPDEPELVASASGVRLRTPAEPEPAARVVGLDGKSYPATKPPSLDFRRAIQEFPELAPERSPGLPEKTVVQMAERAEDELATARAFAEQANDLYGTQLVIPELVVRETAT